MADTAQKPESTPAADEKAEDKELLTLDDEDAQNDAKSVVTEKSMKPEDDDLDDEEHIIEVNVRPRKKDEAESDLSSSDDDDELISNTEQWDITFKLAQFLDNHFILPLVNHLKNQKKLLQKTQREEKKQEEEDHKDEQQEKKTELAKISLVTEKLVQLYDDEDLNKLEFELLSKTCLIDEQMQLFDVLQDTKMDKSAALKQALNDYKQRIVGKLQELEEICGPLIDFLGDEKSVNDLVREKSFSLEAIQEKNKEIVLDKFKIDHLFAYCRLRYEIGFYQNTDVLLGYYRMLTPDPQKKNAALWGQLSAQILQNKWDDAFKAIRDIREHIEDNLRTLGLNKGEEAAGEDEEAYITKRLRELEEEEAAKAKAAAADGDGDGVDADENKEDAKEAKEDEKDGEDEDDESKKKEKATVQIGSIMRDRAWLLHWSLFVFFNKENALNELIALFQGYITTIQTLCPHLLRYVTAAILLSENTDNLSKLKYLSDACRWIEDDNYVYRDPLTEFIRLLMRANDFEKASEMLSLAYKIVSNDYFLSHYRNYILELGRLAFVKKYCRLYSMIDVSNLSKLLLMDSETNTFIQTWLVKAIRQENIDARLDVVNNILHVRYSQTNAYQTLAEKTRGMNIRTIRLFRQIRNKAERPG